MQRIRRLHYLPCVKRLAASCAQSFFSDCQLLDEIFFNAIAGSRLVADRNHSFRRYLNFRIDDVFLPVAFGGGDGSGQAEVLQRGKRDVVGAADAGFEHATAPDWDLLGVADVVDFHGFAETADPADFDVDDAACAGLDGNGRGAGADD